MPVCKIERTNPKFKELLEYYKDKRWSDYYLASALQLYREHKEISDPNWYPETPQERGALTRYINFRLVIDRMQRTGSSMTRDDVYNLYQTLYDAYSPQTLSDRVNMITNDFEDVVDALAKSDTTGRSRLEIINAQGHDGMNGFKAILKDLFEAYAERVTPDEMFARWHAKHPDASEKLIEKARKDYQHRAEEFQKILQHKERLAALVAAKVGEREGFKVNIQNFEIKFDENQTPDISDEEREDDGTDPDDGSKGERFVDFRTFKIMDTIAPRARRLISRIPTLNYKGKPSLDDMGRVRYIDPRQAAAVLKKVMLDATPDTIMETLETAADTYSWIKGIVDLLDANPDLQTTIYDAFKNSRTFYVYTNFDNGSSLPRKATQESDTFGVMREAGVNQRSGWIIDPDYSCYTDYGAFQDYWRLVELSEWAGKALRKASLYSSLINTVTGEKKEFYVRTKPEAVLKAIKDEFGEDGSWVLEMDGVDAINKLLDDNPDILENLAHVYRGMGFVVSPKELRRIATAPLTRRGFESLVGRKEARTYGMKLDNLHITTDKDREKLNKQHFINSYDYTHGRNRLSLLIGWGIYAAYDSPQGAKGFQDEVNYIYNTSGLLRRVSQLLAFTKKAENETRVVNEGKSLSRYNPVSRAQQIWEEIYSTDTMTEEEAHKLLWDRFIQYEGYALGSGNNVKLTGWLKDWWNYTTKGYSTNISEAFVKYNCLGYNHVAYAKLSRTQKAVNTIVQYFSLPASLRQPSGLVAGWHGIEMPIQSDYETAYDFMGCPGHGHDDIIDSLTDEVLIETERITAIQERQKQKNRPVLKVYEERGSQFQIFPEFNTNGFLKRYREIQDPAEARRFIHDQIEEQMKKVIAYDYKVLEDSGALKHPTMRRLYDGDKIYVNMWSKDGTVKGIDHKKFRGNHDFWKEEDLKKYTPEAYLEAMFENIFYARVQMCKIFQGGLAQFNGLLDFEKRNMLSHAPHSSLNTNATWKGKRVGKQSQNVVYIEDPVVVSAFLKDIEEMLYELLDEKVITKRQYDIMRNSYKKITITDGQGFRTLESYREVCIMEDAWSDRLEIAYNHIMAGKPSSADIECFLQNKKPVFSGEEIIPAADGEGQKPVKLTVLHKYSEEVLLPLALAEHCLQAKSVPLQAFDIVRQRMKDKLSPLTDAERGEMQSLPQRINKTQALLSSLQRVWDRYQRGEQTWQERHWNYDEVTNKGWATWTTEKEGLEWYLADEGFTKFNGKRVERLESVDEYGQPFNYNWNNHHHIKEDEFLNRLSVIRDQYDSMNKRLTELKKKDAGGSGGIDMFLFHSGAKVGAHSVLCPFATWRDVKGDSSKGISDDQARRDRGWDGRSLDDYVLTDAQSMADYMSETIEKEPWTIHKLDYKWYGISASTPAHVADDSIAWASQAEKAAFSNIQDGDKVFYNGEWMDAKEARKLYYDIKTATIMDAFERVRKTFNNPDELERLLNEEIADRSYTSPEVKYALAHLKDGTFALPLYSPNVEHQVQQILAAVLKKRLTKPKGMGANILQATSFGMDIDASMFDNSNALTEDEKLSIVFEGEGKDKRIKYVEVFLPIHDSRLLQFADKDGKITPERLRELKTEKKIDEKILEFVAYRTPSDAEHSIIPCRVKGFMANTGGATLVMPKEIMVMTGHDYDGDKMRCHFANFDIAWNEDAIRKAYDGRGVSDGMTFEEYSKQLKSRLSNIDKTPFKKAKYIEYDTSKSAIENSKKARDNARVALIFAEQTSPAGSRRMIIPGGCDESKHIAKSIAIVRAAHNGVSRSTIANALVSIGVGRAAAEAAVGDSAKLYNLLRKMNGGDVAEVLQRISNSTTPFSFAHSVEAFDSIMGGAQMISIYAMYNSAFQMFQRLHLSYVPYGSKKDSKYEVTLFGHTFGKLFQITDSKDNLASLTLARLLNAAVDNNKDPILGYLNQSPELAEITFLMDAAGMTEEQIHLVLNQPVVLELVKRLRNKTGFTKAVNDILGEFDFRQQNNREIQLYVENSKKGDGWRDKVGLSKVAKLDENDFAGDLGYSYQEMLAVEDPELHSRQLAVLFTLEHLYTPANTLADFVRLTRPDSDNGTIKSSVASLIAKRSDLKKFRDRLKNESPSELQFTGMGEVLKERDVHEGWDTNYLREVLDSELPEVSALNALLVDNGIDLFRPFFPTAKPSWESFAGRIAAKYKYRKMQEGTVQKILEEMILWKLLDNKKFMQGDIKEEQKRIVLEVPKQLQAFQKRVREAVNNPESTDKFAKQFAGNVFLKNLEIYWPKNMFSHYQGKTPRIRFKMNGPVAEGSADMIRAGWAQLVHNRASGAEGYEKDCEEALQLGIDLFKYNMFTNGFSYGMYEFSHFAPFPVLVHVPVYIDALQDIMKTDWKDPNDMDNFYNQYVMNHWGDKSFLYKYPISKLKTNPTAEKGQILLSSANDMQTLLGIAVQDYVIITSRGETVTKRSSRGEEYQETNEIQTLYKVSQGADKNSPIVLTKVNKLGVRGKSGQITLQYNPQSKYSEMESTFEANDRAWAEVQEANFLGNFWEGASEPAGQATPIGFAFTSGLDMQGFPAPSLSIFGIDTSKAAQTAINIQNQTNNTGDKGASGAAVSNSGKDITPGQAVGDYSWVTGGQQSQEKPPVTEDIPAPTIDDMPPAELDPNLNAIANASLDAFGLGGKGLSFDPSLLSQAQVGSSDAVDNNVDDQQNGSQSGNSSDDVVFRKSGTVTLMRKGDDGMWHKNVEAATPANILEARRQMTHAELIKRIPELFRNHGMSPDLFKTLETFFTYNGVDLFDSSRAITDGMLELVRAAKGYETEVSDPDNVAVMATYMLGFDHPLVKRLKDAVANDENGAMQEALDGRLDDYVDAFGLENFDNIALESATRLISKEMFKGQKVQSKSVGSLVRRTIDAIKRHFNQFSIDELQSMLFDAQGVSSAVGRGMLGGRLLDENDIQGNTEETILFRKSVKKVKKDLTSKNDVLSRLLKISVKRLSILERREAYYNKDNPSASHIAAQIQIDKLQAAIKNNKTESAIITYITDSLDYLAETKKSLDDALLSGRPANNICKKLNTVRDTLYSFYISLDVINEAVRDGEISDSTTLAASIDRLNGVLSRFRQQYEKLGLTYFEGMLSSVYGENGRTVTVGKDKGRVISIHEMATRADHDISFMSRMFNALADCNDLVLKAFDEITRNAKYRARRRASDIRPRIETAIADLIRETGSRDQSFMFETVTGEDGKLHRNGKYISEEQAKALSPAKYKFWKTMMDIKKDADKMVPPSMLDDEGRKIIMVRKYTMDKFLAAEGAKNKALVEWEGLKNRVLDTSDDFDPKYKDVVVDFEGNQVDRLPLKFLFKGKNETYDDMTDDVASSMMAYVGMAYEYGEMNNVIGVLENAKYMAANRNVVQKAGGRTKRERIETDDYKYSTAFTQKQAKMHCMQVLNDYFQMHIYNHIRADEGTFGDTRISKRKTADVLNAVASSSQMALNLPQRIANVSTGLAQIFIETVGGGYFNAKDVAWAAGVYMKETPDRFADTGKTETDNKLSLFAERFDLHQDNGRRVTKYKKGRMSRIFNTNLLYAGLTAGEDFLSLTTGLAVARNIKMKGPDGKTGNLWDAYEVKYTDPTNKTGAYLVLKEGWTKADGTAFTADDELRFSQTVAAENFRMQGIYNLDDRSAIQQYALGSLIIMYRKWMAPALRRRFGAAQYNALSAKDEEGYYATLWRIMKDSFADMKDARSEEEGIGFMTRLHEDVKAYKNAAAINWNKMNAYEKSNVKRAGAELLNVLLLFLASSLLLRLPPDDHDGDEMLCWLDNMTMSQLLRLRTELGAQAPTPMMVREAVRLVKSPFAAAGPLMDTLNIFQLMLPTNYITTIKSGRYKGHSKAYKYFREFPIISMFKKIDNFIDPTPMLTYYSNDTIL